MNNYNVKKWATMAYCVLDVQRSFDTKKESLRTESKAECF